MKNRHALTIAAMASLCSYAQGFSPALAQTRDEISFLAVGDLHTVVDGCNELPEGWDPAPDYLPGQTTKLITALNTVHTAATATWPTTTVPYGSSEHFAQSGSAFDEPRGLLVPGDVTERGGISTSVCNEWGNFDASFPVKGGTGTNPLQFHKPVFEGYGNHDFNFRALRSAAEGLKTKVSAEITLRSERTGTNDRANLFTSGHFGKQTLDRGAYYWDWDDIRFFNLNVKPSGGAAPIGSQVLECTEDTNQYHSADPGEDADNECKEIIKNDDNEYRVVHPQ